MKRRRDRLGGWLALLAGLLAFGFVAAGVLAYQAGSPGLRDLVAQALPHTRVGNPVTAVLLDVRGYDTMLEVGVLLLAWLAASASNGPSRGRSGRPTAGVLGPSGVSVDRILARLLLAPLLLVAAYLLWRGTDGPGGALQAGAVVAATAVAWRLGSGAESSFTARPLRWLAPAAMGVFLLAGAGVGIVTGTFLDYPQTAVREIIMGIEVATAGSVAFILAALFACVLNAPDDVE